MSDQATRLRGLMETRLRTDVLAPQPNDTATAAKVIAVTSGKGGVGKSTVALNLAVALRRGGQSVCLIDANPGLANIDLLCGLNGYWNLSHVLSGARRLNDVVMRGPEDVHVLSGAGELVAGNTIHADAMRELESLETDYDSLVIDTGSGLHAGMRAIVSAADVGLIITTPEPTAIADAYATVKSLVANPPQRVMAVVNLAPTAGQANAILDRLRQTSRTFLNAEIINGGSIPLDPELPKSVLQRTPLLVCNPLCPAAENIVKLTQRVRAAAESTPGRGRFFERLAPSRTRAAA